MSLRVVVEESGGRAIDRARTKTQARQGAGPLLQMTRPSAHVSVRRERHADGADETRERPADCGETVQIYQPIVQDTMRRTMDQRRLGTFGISKRNEPAVERVGDGLRELDALARPDARPRSIAGPLGGVIGEPSSGVRGGRLVCRARLRKSRRLRAAGFVDGCGGAEGVGEGEGVRSTPLPLSPGGKGAGSASSASALSREPSLLKRVSSGIRRPDDEDALALGGDDAGEPDPVLDPAVAPGMGSPAESREPARVSLNEGRLMSERPGCCRAAERASLSGLMSMISTRSPSRCSTTIWTCQHSSRPADGPDGLQSRPASPDPRPSSGSRAARA